MEPEDWQVKTEEVQLDCVRIELLFCSKMPEPTKTKWKKSFPTESHSIFKCSYKKGTDLCNKTFSRQCDLQSVSQPQLHLSLTHLKFAAATRPIILDHSNAPTLHAIVDLLPERTFNDMKPLDIHNLPRSFSVPMVLSASLSLILLILVCGVLLNSALEGKIIGGSI